MSADGTNSITFDVIKDSLLGTLKKYAVFSGRARRREYWLFFLASFVVGLVLGWIPVIGWLVSLALFIPSLSVGVRRLHDTGRGGLTLLLALIPLVGIIILIVFWAQEGAAGENKFGPDPKTASASVPAAKGETVCPACGMKNLSDAKFCAGCGGKMEAGKRICACGTELEPGTKFCSKCGAKVE
jgi:uncharacterized membrane protein YhaH (DUF805 family)